jgi:hypothetical protein
MPSIRSSSLTVAKRCQGRFEIRPKGGGKSDQFFI